MKLEEIRDALDDSHPSEFEYDKIAYRRLMESLDAAIAERALPVTRELLADRYGKPAKLMNDRVWTVNENFEVREEDLRFVVRRSQGHFVAYVETRGQLLDLLSGLGVRN